MHDLIVETTLNTGQILNQIAEKFKNSRNIDQKRKLDPLLDKIRTMGYSSEYVYASIGEDAAAIRIDQTSSELILITTDTILSKFIQSNPYAAGYSAVYVGIDDIFACGGIPTAVTINMEYSHPEMGDQMLNGILDATKNYRIPLVRGHTVTDADRPFLSSTMIGRSTINRFISIKNADVGNRLALVYDANGSPGPVNRFYFNTILNKQTDDFYLKRQWIAKAKNNSLIDTCKDISNGGILGTLYQMLSYCEKGAVLTLDPLFSSHFLKEKYYTILELLFAYLTSAFIISYLPTCEERLCALITDCKMNMIPFGTLVNDSHLQIRLGYEGELLY